MVETKEVDLMSKHKFKIQIRGRMLPDFLFWTISFFVLLNIFAGPGKWQKIDYIYTSIFITTLIMAVTVNFWLIMPKYLSRKLSVLFLLFTALNILVFTFFNQLLFDKLIDYILPGYYFISYYEFGDLLKFFFVFVTLTTLIQLSREWFQLQETHHSMVVLEKGKIDAELKALTNQVNPHFLFNSLTVLYSLALKNSAETSGAIIKLSDILRYVIYDAASGKVSLKSEINIIRNYIDLQRYRIDPTTRIDFKEEIEDENTEVIPMLFLPLVENSFKHGVKSEVSAMFITIVLKSVGGVVNFTITNNKSDMPSNEKASGGIGLKNIEDRLKLVYKNAYTFSVSQTDTAFTVNLKMYTRL